MSNIIDLPWERGKGWGPEGLPYHASEGIRQLIDETVTLAWHACEKCGSTTGVNRNTDGHLLTLCPKCRKKSNHELSLNEE